MIIFNPQYPSNTQWSNFNLVKPTKNDTPTENQPQKAYTLLFNRSTAKGEFDKTKKTSTFRFCLQENELSSVI